MAHSYIAYIDECGDDGLGRYRTPGSTGGASTWLTLSATVCRASRDLEMVEWRNEIRSKLGPRAQKKALHFKDMNHGQRTIASQILSAKALRGICVVANKPIIPIGLYTEKNQLYFYLCRYLIERISWLCRDMRRGSRGRWSRQDHFFDAWMALLRSISRLSAEAQKFR